LVFGGHHGAVEHGNEEGHKIGQVAYIGTVVMVGFDEGEVYQGVEQEGN